MKRLRVQPIRYEAPQYLVEPRGNAFDAVETGGELLHENGDVLGRVTTETARVMGWGAHDRILRVEDEDGTVSYYLAHPNGRQR